jgi:ATP-binding cassette subfamily C protein CydD/ATP-binding cassette subfamily C protein CydCD
VTAVLGAGEAAATVAQALLLAHAIAIGVTGAQDGLVPALLRLVAAVVVRAAFAFLAEATGRDAGRRAVAELRERAVEAALRDGATRPGARRPGELATAWVHGADAVATYVGRYVPASVAAGVAPLLVLAAVLVVDPLSAGLLAFATPIVVVFLILVGTRAQDAAEQRHASMTLLGGHLLDVLRGLPTLRAYGREDAQAEQVRRAGEHYRAGTMATLREAFLSGLVLEFMAMLGTALVAVACGIRLAQGHLEFGPAIAALVLAPEVFLPLRRLGAEFHASADAEPLLRELADRARPDNDAAAGPGPWARNGAASAVRGPVAAHDGAAPAGLAAPDPGRNAIVLDGVVVRHAGRRDPALDGLSARFAPGTTTILTGPSGAGKSTVLRLLLGLATPDAGTVRCGGQDLSTVDLAAWRAGIAWIPQRPVLLPASLRDNVRFGVEADDAALREALRTVGLAPLLEALPAGLDTPLGDVELPMSAGERRRLGVARALLRDPALVLVDEPTANLDRVTAEEVTDALAALLAGRTGVVATHDALPRRLGEHVLDLTRPAVPA